MKNLQWLKCFLNVSSFHDLYVLKRRKHQYQGFTLIELLVVIMIMTILSGIAIPPYLSLVRTQQVQVVAYEIQEYIKCKEDPVYFAETYFKSGDCF